MNVAVLYLLLLKGTVTAFAGLASLPVIQDELVIHRHVLTDTQLNEAVVITRSTPGPVGLCIISVGYFVAGVPGTIAGWLAMITPALLIIPLVHFVGRRMDHPRVKSILQTVVIASAGLLLAAAIPLARDALTGPVTVAIAAISFAFLLTTKLYSVDHLRRRGMLLVGGFARHPNQVCMKPLESVVATGSRISDRLMGIQDNTARGKTAIVPK
jgi:chromate transporter